MILKVDLEFTAKDAKKAIDRGDLMIVIDVLRATTTIITALANGATSLIPTATLKQAHQLHEQHPDYLLAGERQGHTLKGFQLGNSPLEFTPESVHERTIILTTTSGTKAILKAQKARYVLIGAFLNAKSIADKAVEIATKQKTNLSIILASEKGQFSAEDFICAGAIAKNFPKEKVSYNDKSQVALLVFKQAKDNLLENIKQTRHAKHLIKLGYKKDIEHACQLDTHKLVPVYRNGRIMPSK